MSFKDFDDDYLVLSPQLHQQLQPSSIPSDYGNFNTTSITASNSKPQRRTSNFFPTNENAGVSTPNIQLSSDCFSFQPISNSSSTMTETQQQQSNNISSSNSHFIAFHNHNVKYNENPLSPFYNKAHSVATSTLTSPVLNTFNQPTFNRLDTNGDSLSNNFGNLSIQSLSTTLNTNHTVNTTTSTTSATSLPQTPTQHQSLPQTPQQRFNGFMISNANSTSGNTNNTSTTATTPTTTVSDFSLQQPALSIWNNSINNSFEIELPQSVMKRENRYSNKVNNPVFIPSGPKIPESNIVEESEILSAFTEQAIEDDDEDEFGHNQEDKEPDNKPVKHLPSESNESDQDIDCPRIKFPEKVPYTSKNDYFIQDMVNYDLTNRYSEGYSTTFYKRNKHGYMFIRESTNTLHVHQNSWIQLKIKLPVNNHKKLLIKKLKVDIKELPIWKPKA
ncbi:hypothetical protein K6H11_002413 [Candida tropicalis]